VPHEPELIAELGPERADDRDVHREVDQHNRQSARRGEIPEGTSAAVGVGQRQPEGQREHGQAADRHDRSLAAGQPGQYRGRVDIWINGSYWAGAILGSFVSYIFLNHFAPNVGWRLAFLLGPVLAVVVIIVGRVLPESPRWLVTHGGQEEADRVMAKIEEDVRKSGQELAPIDESKAIDIAPESRYGYLTFLRLVFHQYPGRAILGATLMITQSFLYNAPAPARPT
jgi:hypothetical protein